MTKIVNVAWGLCAPMRPEHVLTMLEPYGVNVQRIDMYANRYGSGAKVEVTDQAAEWVEYLLCRSGKFSLVSRPLNPKNLVWAKKWQDVPTQRGCEKHSEGGAMGRMPTPWGKGKEPTTRPASGGIMETLRDVFTGSQQMPIRTRRAERRQRRGR